jgi:uncharacterized protein YdeI (BOF family)
MKHPASIVGLCCALAAAPAFATEPLVEPAAPAPVASPVTSDWVVVSGIVQSVGSQSFVLDTGKSQIPVDMDGYASLAIRPGERVTVTGRMEMPLDGPHVLNAASVDVPERNQRFYANPSDDGGGAFAYSVAPRAPLAPAAAPAAPLTLTGTVVEASAPDAFILATTSGTYAVDGRNLAPTFPARRLLIGDRVSVSGSLDTSNLFDRRQIDAQSITLLSPTSAM